MGRRAPDVEEWVAEASRPTRKCTICRNPALNEFVRAAYLSMQRQGVRVGRGKVAAKLGELLGRPVCEGTLRVHLLQRHDPETPHAARG